MALSSSRSEKIRNIPTGNTCRGLNKAIILYLTEYGQKHELESLLDIPCGDGEFIQAVKSFFQKLETKGCDISAQKNLPDEDYSVVDASTSFKVFNGKKFNVVTSISGVMEFDNTLQFFQSCHYHLKDDGIFIVTNDNHASVYDRFLYLFLGRTRQFKLFPQPLEWKLLPMQNMVKLLQDANFQIIKIKYILHKAKYFWMTPFALILYPIQFFYMLFSSFTEKNIIPNKLKFQMYPFSSLIYRDYIIFCRKK